MVLSHARNFDLVRVASRCINASVSVSEQILPRRTRSCSCKIARHDASAISASLYFVELSIYERGGACLLPKEQGTKLEISRRARVMARDTEMESHTHTRTHSVESRKKGFSVTRARCSLRRKRVTPGSKKISRFATLPSFLPLFRVYRSL